MLPDNEEYLGDGLYVSHEHNVIKLRAPRDDGDHEVFLEPHVLANFLAYINSKRRTK